MLRWAIIILSMLCLRSILNLSLELKLAFYSSFKQLLRLYKVDCLWLVLEIDSIDVLDNILVSPFLRCSSYPFKCLVVTVLPCCIKKYTFLCINPCSAGLSLQLFDEDYCFWLLCQIKFHRKSCFLLIVLIQQLLLFGWILIGCTRATTTLIFLANFISRITIYVCTYNIISICVVINCPFISFKIFSTVFNWFCSFLNWFKWIMYFCNE